VATHAGRLGGEEREIESLSLGGKRAHIPLYTHALEGAIFTRALAILLCGASLRYLQESVPGTLPPTFSSVVLRGV
jgi:hypothetical protein